MSIEEKDPALKALITERNDIIQNMVNAGLMTTKEMFGLRREWKEIEKTLTPNSIDDTTTSKIQRKIDKLQIVKKRTFISTLTENPYDDYSIPAKDIKYLADV